MSLHSAVQMMVGEFIRPLDTVQFKLYSSPALAIPDLAILIVMASDGTTWRDIIVNILHPCNIEKISHFQLSQ